MKKVVFSVVQNIIDLVMGMAQILADTVDRMASAVGKKLTIGKDLRAWRDSQKTMLKSVMGIEETAAATKAPPTGVVSAAAPLPGAAPAVAAVPPGSTLFESGPAAIAAAAARAAMAGLPPTQVNATMVVDGEVLGRIAARANASDASRSGASSAVDMGG
jgi:hypothetical protein